MSKTFGSVRVPVLSKHRFLTWAPSTVLWGSVPIIPFNLKRTNETVYAILKKIGKGGGAEDPR